MNTYKGKTGQSLVEFMLIIPVVVFAITAFIDLGRAVFCYSALSNAVREGTRYAVVHPLETTADQDLVIKVVKDTAAGLNPDAIDVDITPPTETSYVVTIHASYTFSPVTPGLSLVLGAGKNIVLHAESSMEVAPLYQ
ncbi:MAG: TadE family protein [Anaerolineaceae bacterium]